MNNKTNQILNYVQSTNYIQSVNKIENSYIL